MFYYVSWSGNENSDKSPTKFTDIEQVIKILRQVDSYASVYVSPVDLDGVERAE